MMVITEVHDGMRVGSSVIRVCEVNIFQPLAEGLRGRGFTRYVPSL